MSRRKDRGRTPGLWIATNELPSTGGHPFYQRLNHFLDAHGFDDFVEAQCAPFYAATVGRPNAHLYETGRMRRTHLRGHANILKRLVVHIGGFNLGLLMRSLVGIGTPRSLQGRLAAVVPS